MVLTNILGLLCNFKKYFIKFFLIWIIFKVFIEFVTMLLLFYVLFFGQEACGIIAPGPGIKPIPPALDGEALDHQRSLIVYIIFITKAKRWGNSGNNG